MVWAAPYYINGTSIKLLAGVNGGIVCVTNTTADFIGMDNGASNLDKKLRFDAQHAMLMAHSKTNNPVGFFIGIKIFELNYGTFTVKETLNKFKF